MLKFNGHKEDMPLVRGLGQYSSDWNLPAQLQTRFLRADRAHAAIRSIDTEATKGMNGVVAVLRAQPLPMPACARCRRPCRTPAGAVHTS